VVQLTILFGDYVLGRKKGEEGRGRWGKKVK
jgi:hypothetical protein